MQSETTKPRILSKRWRRCRNIPPNPIWANGGAEGSSEERSRSSFSFCSLIADPDYSPPKDPINHHVPLTLNRHPSAIFEIRFVGFSGTTSVSRGRVEHPCSTAADQGWSALQLPILYTRYSILSPCGSAAHLPLHHLHRILHALHGATEYGINDFAIRDAPMRGENCFD